jgi:lysophospholipase L1-like esterase
LDTYQFAQAYDKLIRLIRAKYPKAKVFCIIGDNVMDAGKTAYAKVIRDVCNQYGLHYAEVVFSDRASSTYDNVHPNVAGMTDMANQIWNQVKNYL